ncbi:MAG: endolytic transglycosylase MltG [Elusimicrobiota bacterium]
MSSGLKIMIILFIVFSARAPFPKKVNLSINSGMSASEIAQLLKEKDIISGKNPFLFFLRFTGQAKKIKAGMYNLYTGMNYITLIKELVSGTNYFIEVTFPEGFTTEQIGKRLVEKNVIEDPEEFVGYVEKKNLRGFLLPETYKFLPMEKPKNIVRVMRNQFFKIFDQKYRKRAEQMEYSLKEVVTIASLIEKEAKVPEERKIISAIFHKRLKRRIYLESCASILFALGKHKNRLTYKDLEIDSPYNTYKNFGLPPTPICNPGRESLKAALYPADTDYIYFFSKGDGSHVFSSTYREHIRKQKLLY